MSRISNLSRRGFLTLVGGAATVGVAGLAGCGGSSSSGAAASGSASGSSDKTQIAWARDNSGNIFQEIAIKKGWFDEVGIEITEEPFDTANDAVTALQSNELQIISNYGTNLPLQTIAKGEPLQIVGGYMATGCMPIITNTDNKDYKGVKSFVGKKIASDASEYVLSGPLLELGYDPLKDVKWVTYNNYSDMTAAVIQGEVDYAIVGTSRNYEVQQQPKLKVVAYKSDIMPWYSCCRMCVMDSWMKENEDTLKTVISVLLRGQAYYEASDANKEEAKEIMMDVMNVSKDYLNSYMDNKHFRISVDPLTDEVIRAWNILGETGFLDDGWKDIKIADYIQTDLYKEALDMSQENYGDEFPDFYKKMQKFYSKHNTGKAAAI